MKTKMPDKLKHIHLIAPNIFGYKGGIQVYTFYLLKTLQELYPDLQYHVYLKYDKTKHLTNWPGLRTRFYLFGHWPRWLQSFLLSLSLLIAALRFPKSLFWVTHPNYAIVCHWLKLFTGKPYWIVAHGLEVWSIQNPLLKIALIQSDLILPVSNFTKRYLQTDQKISSHKMLVLPNTFDPEEFTIKSKPQYLLERYNLKPDHKIIFTLARCNPYKGYELILKQISRLKQQFPVHYILAGHGSQKPHIRELVQKYRLEASVTLAGFIPEAERCDHYNLCDVFAMPSTGEGFGIVFLEALACGKPVIAGNVDGASDPLLQGEIGCLVDLDEDDELYLTISSLLQGSHPNKLLYEPQKLREIVIENYGIEAFRAAISRLPVLQSYL